MNSWGTKFRLSIFGESHGKAIGIILDGVPSGISLDLEKIRQEMARRAPGKSPLSTPRNEEDDVQIVSGFFDGKTTGTPLTVMIENTDTRSKDYQPELLRPGHADFTGFCKYGESHDYRGGGHFSGRITAPLVFAGAVAKQILKEKGIFVGAHISQIGEIADTPFDKVNLDKETLLLSANQEFPVLDSRAGESMQKQILDAQRDKDSIGGMVECGVIGLPAGIGDPFFDSVESRISSMMFSIPAVKGIEFGDGFNLGSMKGSCANDAFEVVDRTVRTKTNHNGGINGGITNGMPLVFRVVIKPTPSIGKKQETVNLKTMENIEFSVQGRHDPCIVHRAVSVVEAGIALLDMIL